MKALRFLLSGVYLAYILFLSGLYVAAYPFIMFSLSRKKNYRIDDAIRCTNRLYGFFLVKCSWPLVRIRCTGAENLPRNGSTVIVANHRSTSDMFFSPFFTTSNTTVFVRSWPFRIWGLGWFMRRAGYLDMEKSDINYFLAGAGAELFRRGVSFLFFPEGHRSRTGKLQLFRSGAFLTAVEYNIPVIPVCLTGTETFQSMKDHMFRPAVIVITILPPVYPAAFPPEKRALKLKRHVEALIKEHLNEH